MVEWGNFGDGLLLGLPDSWVYCVHYVETLVTVYTNYMKMD